MLSDTLAAHLNRQINLEQYSANLYLQMSSWCDSQGLTGCTAFLRGHADEEMDHMHRLFQYVNASGGMALIGAIKEPRHEFKDVADVFEVTLAHEKDITKAINDLAKAAFGEGDFSTFNFLQWYVAEQHEEEVLFKHILDRIRLIGTEGTGLFMIDQELGKLADEAASASTPVTPAE
ncbi:MAG: ferritin [Bacteroidia bacterium]|jgi:ferritin